ncbi:MAG TPA: YbjN domain-containing protein [Caulobacteraceae bacterium]|jgi:hypothetical protein
MKLSTVVGGLAGALILGACAATASARDIPSGGLTYEEVASWLRASGYPATIKPDTSDGAKSYERIVSSSVDGVNYDIYFYGCIKGRCDSIQYAAGWPSSRGSLDRINGWNTAKRYIRAYSTASGQYWAEYDIDVSPGGTYEQLDHTLTRWRSIIGEYKTYMGF